MSKSILQIIYSCSVQKTVRKNTKYSRNEINLKIGHYAKVIAIFANFQNALISRILAFFWDFSFA